MKVNKHSSANRGVVLLAMLVFIFMLTFIVVLFIEEVEGRIRYRAQTSGDHDLRRIAYDYLEHSFAVLAEFQTFDEGLNDRIQGWGNPLTYAPFPLEYSGVEASVSIEDATVDLPLSEIKEEEFLTLLEALGINPFEATRFRDGYFDWVDQDDESRIQGAEKREYEIDRRFTLSPANQEITNEQEFDYIKGFRDLIDPDSRFFDPHSLRRFKEMISLRHSYPVNLNVASDDIKEFFRLSYAMKPDVLGLYKAGNDRILGTEDDEYFTDDVSGVIASAMGSGGNKLFGYEMKLCRINIDLMRYGSAGFHLEALVDLGGGASDENEDASSQVEVDQNSQNENSDSEEDSTSNKSTSGESNSEKFEVLVIYENFVDSQ